MGKLLKHSKRLEIPDTSMRKVKTFKSPGIKDLGTMDSKNLFNVDSDTAKLSTAGLRSGTTLEDIGSKEGRKLGKSTKRSFL